MTSIVDQAAAYGAQPEISARSLLVTVFGDSIAPTGGGVWLGDLIKLVEPFAFSERLVRTSIYRLGTEGWFDTVRVGRRSRYSLSGTGRHEFALAERRIYHPPSDDWNGDWTIVFANGDQIDDDAKPDFVAALRWLGFGQLAAGVFGSPTATLDDVKSAAKRSALAACPLSATARFSNLAALTDQPSFEADFGLSDSIASYESFIGSWERNDTGRVASGQEAFLIRTMLVHDFRRARYDDPDLPASLLTTGWAGGNAYKLAAKIFGQVNGPANEWLTDTWELSAAPAGRFATPVGP